MVGYGRVALSGLCCVRALRLCFRALSAISSTLVPPFLACHMEVAAVLEKPARAIPPSPSKANNTPCCLVMPPRLNPRLTVPWARPLPPGIVPVSYTHLTLPTKRIV
eukprot:TRINITY_DN47560_c0_g1_i4.p1 TRINITY_DN47560_c0_g1~~TRINITY_DN47560_c0_g1_i4.p1  ORF type:complete len:107 (+),score=11.02 TRINITY_DN47560_c0_g1_i4:108-428(+)